MASLTRFIEGRLKLQVNAQKSAVARPWQRSFLGFTVTAYQEASSLVLAARDNESASWYA